MREIELGGPSSQCRHRTNLLEALLSLPPTLGSDRYLRLLAELILAIGTGLVSARRRCTGRPCSAKSLRPGRVAETGHLPGAWFGVQPSVRQPLRRGDMREAARSRWRRQGMTA